MHRRRFLVFVAATGATRALAGASFRGRLTRDAAGKPVLESNGRRLRLSGDADTEAVLADDRLLNADLEVIGREAGGAVAIDPMHSAALWVHKDGRRLRITYWCDICAIRTYTPGLCVCCREETVLDLREPDKVDTK